MKPQTKLALDIVWRFICAFAGVCLLLMLARDLSANELKPQPKPRHCEVEVRKMAYICVKNIDEIYQTIIATCSKSSGGILDFELPGGKVLKIYCAKVQEV